MGSKKSFVTLVAFCAALAILAIFFVSRSHAAQQEPPKKAEPGAQDPAHDAETGLKPNPKLLVPPLSEEEVQLTEKVKDRPDFVAQLPIGNGFIFERKVGGKKIAGVVIPAVVLVTRGAVELFGCGEGGKEHETILRLECDVQSLDLALTSAGLKRGKLGKKGDITNPEQGSRVVILVQWNDPSSGRCITYRSEDLVISLRRQTTMPRVGWTYVGNWAQVPDPASPKGEKKHQVLLAAQSRSYVTTFRDHSALLDNPLEEAIDDTIFSANFMILPRSGTPVRVILRTPTEAELKEILELEKDIAKAGPPTGLRHGLHREEAGKDK